MRAIPERPGLLGRMAAAFGRSGDRVPGHVPDVVLGLEDRPPPAQTLALALQQIAIQSIYFLLPGMVATAFGAGPLEATNFLCLSLISVAVATALQVLTRGPVGSGYPVPSIPSIVMLAPMLLAAQLGASLAEASTMVVMVGIVTVVVAPAVRRLSALLPTEVMGVIVFLIGASVLPSVLAMAGADAERPAESLPRMLVMFGCFFVMVVVGVLRWRFARYAVLAGTLAGVAGALAAGMATPGAAELLEAAPWFALPRPGAHGGIAFDPTLVVSFLLCTVAAIAALLGSLVAFQRAVDGDWTRPDPGPLRRGLLAHGVAVAAAGLMGGMPAAVSSASVGLAIATRTFARTIALAGAGILFLLAFSPKLVALFVLVPAPVQAAMLLYVACFMMAQGSEMIVIRKLDARRTVVAGLGLSAGLSALVAPGFFAAAMPALAAPLAVGGLVAFLANLVTLPLVKRVETFPVRLDGRVGDLLDDRTAQMGGAWGLRPDTVRKMHHALMELCDLLIGRGLGEAVITATQLEERVRIAVAFTGPPLPKPKRRPRAEDIEAGGDALEMTALWLALRETSEHGMRATTSGQELWMDFQD